MSKLKVNVLTRYDFPLFSQHVRSEDDGLEFVENGPAAGDWDLVVVFDGLPEARSLSVRRGGLVFIAGEPPDAIAYTDDFLSQFDATFCAHPYARKRPRNHSDQYYNNWHFGYDPTCKQFRWTFERLSDIPRPEKTRDMSVIMSNLAYMPNHLKRRHFLARLQERFGSRIDVYGRGHRFIPYKEDALLAYRYHVCIENCVVPNLWTEKLADPFLSWSIPVYGGCPNVSDHFPTDSMVRIDVDDVEGSLTTIARLLDEGQAGYERRLQDVIEARRRVLETHNITTLVRRLAADLAGSAFEARTVRPNERSSGYRVSDVLLRARRFAYRRYYLLMRGSVMR